MFPKEAMVRETSAAMDCSLTASGRTRMLADMEQAHVLTGEGSYTRSCDPALWRRILIVDDHVGSADVLAAALAEDGHETRAAYDPFAAIALAAEFQPEVAILDVHLPGMDGYELADALRASFPTCRLIALTGLLELNCLRSQWAGFDAHLTKPVALTMLLTAVTRNARASDSWPSGTFLRSAASVAAPRVPSSGPKRERSQIELHESPEVVRYWTTELRCTETQLRAAVAEVGAGSDNVRDHLAK